MIEPKIYKPFIYNGPTVYNNGGGGGAYVVEEMPEYNFGKDGEGSMLMADVRQVNNGTIIPAQTDMTNCFGSKTDAWKVFDGSNSTYTNQSAGCPIEYGYDFGEGNEKSICSVSVATYSYSKLWFKVRAANDKKNWVDLAVCANALHGSYTYSVTFDNTNYYRYYSVICYDYGSSQGYPGVREIYMTDDRSVMKDPKTPQFFAKQCGIWNFDKYGTAYDCEPTIVYRVNGRNPSTSTIGKFIGQISSDLLVDLEGVVRSSLYMPTSSSAFFGWDNNAQYPFKLRINDIKEDNIDYTEFILNVGSSSNSKITVARSSLLAASTFNVHINKNHWNLYLNGMSVGSKTVGGWVDETHDWDTTCNILGGTYSSGASSQLGLSSIKIIDNKYDRIICDIVGAKRALDNTFGYVDRNSGYYFGYDSNYVNEILL